MLKETEEERSTVKVPFELNWGKTQMKLENCGIRCVEKAQRLQKIWQVLPAPRLTQAEQDL